MIPTKTALIFWMFTAIAWWLGHNRSEMGDKEEELLMKIWLGCGVVAVSSTVIAIILW